MSPSKCLPVFAILTAVLLLTPAACPAADEKLASVQGTVTLDGKPLPEGRVIFHLTDGQFVGCRLKEGKFKIDRAPVGTHKVTIEAYRVAIKPPGNVENFLPPKYSSEEQSALRVEVKQGVNTFDLELKSK